MKHKVPAFLLLLLICTHLVIQTPSAIITKDTDYITTPINIPLRIRVNIWGWDTTGDLLAGLLAPVLPKSFLHTERLDPSTNSSVQYLNLDNVFYRIQYQLKYEFAVDPYKNENREDFINYLNESADIGFNNGIYRDSSQTLHFYSGWSIPVYNVENFLKKYNDGITLHLLNFADLDNTISNNSLHWYRAGQTEALDTPLEDMRSAGYVGDKGIFYDPTALAPRFQPQLEPETARNMTAFTNLLSGRIEQIIESRIVRAPQFINDQQAREHEIHISQVLITGNDSNLARFGQESMAYGSLTNAIAKFIPYMDIEFKQVIINLNDYPKIKSFVDENTRTVDGISAIIFNSTNVETFKYLLRSEKSIYTSFPSRYYYSMVLMAYSPGTHFMYEYNGSLQEYEAGFTGLGMMNLNELQAGNPTYTLRDQMRIFGELLGLSGRTYGFVSQFEDIQSTYGITPSWNRLYHQFDVFSTAAKISITYNQSATYGIRFYRQQLNNFWFQGLNQSELDTAATTLRLGDIEFYRGNYVNATSLYIQGYEQYLQGVQNINSKIGTFYNSIIFTILMSMFGYIIYALFDSGISQDEYKKKYYFKEA